MYEEHAINCKFICATKWYNMLGLTVKHVAIMLVTMQLKDSLLNGGFMTATI
jgi:hypothetical protein